MAPRTATVRATKAQLAEALDIATSAVVQHDASLELYQERIAELEFALEDTGWQRLTLGGEQREFSREALKKLVRLARLAYLKNPLVGHACRVQADYVWGQGCTIVAKDPKVNEVVQAFLDFPKNKDEFTGHTARSYKEIEAQVESNIFVILFTNQSNGMVRLRTAHFDEILDVVKNPEDSREPWYYLRVWTVYEPNQVGEGAAPNVGTTQKAYYPDYRYKPVTRPSTFQQIPIKWDSPMMHIKTGGLSDMTFGVPEIYAALDWARAVKEDLEDYVTIRRALSRFAWNLNTKIGGKLAVANTKEKLNTTVGRANTISIESNPPPVVGATFLSTPGQDITPIKTAGMAPSPDEGKRLWLMVSAGTGIPEPILAGDADVGNFATAKTLDRPTELKMRTRQTMWADVYDALLGYVVDQAVIRINGPLHSLGSEKLDPYTGEKTVVTTVDRTIDIRFPLILERNKLQDVQAITLGATLNGQIAAGTMDDKTLTRLILSALGEEDIDEMLQELYPDNATMGMASQPKQLAQPQGPTGATGVNNNDVTKVGNQEPDMKSRDERVNTAKAVQEAVSEFAAKVRPLLAATRTQLEYDDTGKVIAVVESSVPSEVPLA